jgi:hypothetical protein
MLRRDLKAPEYLPELQAGVLAKRIVRLELHRGAGPGTWEMLARRVKPDFMANHG